MKPPLREARIILPLNPHVYETISAVNALFGGCTVSDGNGHWKNPKTGLLEHEPVHIIDIAYEQNTENDMLLFNIAMKFREDAKQQEVYLRYGNGHVQMVDMHSIMSNGRPNCWYSPDFAGSTDAINSIIDESQTEATRLEAFQYLVKLMSEPKPESGLDWE